MSTQRLARFSCIVGAMVFAFATAFAQSQANTGIIEGIVSDPSGKAVAKAQVTITNLGTNFTRELTSDEEGRFRGLLLPLGPYRVTTKAPSFGTNVREGLHVSNTEIIRVNDALEVLAETDPRLVKVVELLYFAGMTHDEAAEALGVATRTVRRDWHKARLLLSAALQ